MNIKNIIQLLLQSSSDFNKLHDYVITELSKAVNKSVNEANPEELFKIAKTCTPTEKDRVQALLDAYNNAVLSLIKQGITKAVLFSTNTQQNALSAFTRFEGKEVDAWRKETARAFIESRMKRDNGLNLSDRVWNYTQQTKSEFEVAVSQVLENGIGKGISAESLGRQVRQYLNNPDMMYRRYHRKQLMSDGTKKDIVEWRRRVIDKEGKVRFIKEDLAKVGTGVYRSARQNALRLTITETNMAYNYSNCKRWESEPFVLGIRIRLSANHPEEDICDELAGDYPKTFMWRGWHPRCMCSVSPILMDRKSDEWKKLRKMPKEEYEAYQSPNLVQNVPDKFSKWCERNAKKLDLARKSGKLPYFVKDNQKVVGDLLGWKENKNVIQQIALKDGYTSDNFFGNRLQISNHADKIELKENLRSARSILKSFSDVYMDIRPHILEKGLKNPEYTIKGMIADRKGIESPKGIQSAFKKAIKQGCEAVVIDLDMHLKNKRLRISELAKYIYWRYSDFEKGLIKECYVVYNNNAIRITAEHNDKEIIKAVLKTLEP
jgi:hypothetical protein